MLRNSKITPTAIATTAVPLKAFTVTTVPIKAVSVKTAPVKAVSIKVLAFVTTCLFYAVSDSVFADDNPSQNKIHNWQMKQIQQPSLSLLEREAHGFVNIYDGFTDTQVNKIMDQKFERIDNMMFIRVKHTDSRGDVLTDPASGVAIVDDDGC